MLVRSAGLLTSVQDLGRPHARRFGVPVSGAVDTLALRVANLLVGNDEDAAALESTLLGPTLQFRAETLVAVTGATSEVTVDGVRAPMWRPLRVAAGAILSIGRAQRGVRCIVAVAGGIDVPPVLGSRSTCLRGAFGGFHGRALRIDDEVPLRTGQRAPGAPPERGGARAPRWLADVRTFAACTQPRELRFLPDDAFHALVPESRLALRETRYVVTSHSDRMGVRLAGEHLLLDEAARAAAATRPSTPVAVGTIQLPPDGQPIILLADAQVTGGYPILGHVIAADLPRVAQAEPRAALSLVPVTRTAAAAALAAQADDLRRFRVGVRVAARPA